MTSSFNLDWEGKDQLAGIIPLLQVGSIPDTLAYFEESLGFATDFIWPADDTPKWAMVSRDDAHFMLTIDLGTSTGRFLAEKGNGVVFYVITESLDDLYRELIDRGAIMVQDVIEFGGRKQFSVADPNGYVIAFSQPFS